jgi:molybdenum cofactor synthesis domain-containing protein
MEKVRVEDAVGMVLAHDLTKIVPGEFKGPAFKKGHIVQAGDIEELKSIGKNHLWVVPLSEDQVHENEAARRIGAAAGAGTVVAEPAEGKANIEAASRGLLKVKPDALLELNRLDGIALATLHDNGVVEAGQMVAAAKVIPLTMARADLERAERICAQNGPVIAVKPLYPLKCGVIVTGSEVYSGRIQDRFGAVLKAKIETYGGQFLALRYAPDDAGQIQGLILELIGAGAELILISGGMAVDADDVTPQAIREAADEVVGYGAPVLPGAMCMVAYRDTVPLFGVPGCAMYTRTTVIDLLLPRMLAKERLTGEDLARLGHGGLCRHCETCHFPVCSFGKR